MIKNKTLKFGTRHLSHVKSQRGFTLIELLTVIAVIAVLTGILSISYLGVRQRARDAQRKSDLKQIQSALELYRADVDQYPSAGLLTTCGVAFAGPSGAVYMQKIPCDPKNTTAPYFYNPTTTTYTLASCLENGNDKDKVVTAPAGMTVCSPAYYHVVYNP
jgi:general secretion pathway protein G